MALHKHSFSETEYNVCSTKMHTIALYKQTQKPHADNYDVTENIDTKEITVKTSSVK